MRLVVVRVPALEREGKPLEARPPGGNALHRMHHWAVRKSREDWKQHAHAVAVREMARGPFAREWMMTAVGQSGRVAESSSYIADRAAWWPLKRVHISVRWRCKLRRRRDWDNLISGLKPILDALVSAGVIEDDSSDVLVMLGPFFVEVGADADETILTIQEVPEP